MIRDFWEVRKNGMVIRTFTVKKDSLTEEDIQDSLLADGYNLDDVEIEKTEIGE